MLSPLGALLSHLSLALVCRSATRLVSLSAGPDPAVARRLRRTGGSLGLLLAAGWGSLVGTDTGVAAWAATALPGLTPEVYPTLGALALFLGPVPLAAYAAYDGADAAQRRAGNVGGNPGRFLAGYAAAVGPALLVTALAPAVPDGWWLVVGVALVGFLLAAGSPLFVRRVVGSRPLAGAERTTVPTDVPVHVLLTGRDGPANALAAGVLPGFRCVYVTERLVETLPPREAAAIVTHELGHHHRRHVLLRLGAVAAFVLPWLGGTALGVPGAFPAGLVLAVPATLGICRLVRWTEYDADAYAARRVGPDAMRDALCRLKERGLLADHVGGLLGSLAFHPSLATRIARLDGEVRTEDRPGRVDGRSGD